ncbi:pyrroline-5-carboxylate reductase family protein, partial [Acidisphaera rubrifaciens]|uniref:pyrroline-5-carboxylate reductase family protein n=1 Tax=Acidisphaera rubrifaciens TaxID=50715 RepID=UPI0006621F73
MTSETDALPPLLLVGCGNMGGALLAGWCEQGLTRALAVDPAARPADWPPAVGALATADAIPADFRPAAVILAVKPQVAAATLPAYARYADTAVFLSIMAGQTIDGLRALLGGRAAIVRAMPNTPAAIRRGMT